MSMPKKKEVPSLKATPLSARRPAGLQMAAIGLEAEFSLFVDGQHVMPEDLFKDPRSFVRGDLIHRTGTSFHLPTGSAVYFDTGVIELATPAIEIAAGCAARAGRSLWEAIHFLRAELDAWEHKTGHEVRLVGFSTHYNISFGPAVQAPGHTAERLAHLLTYVLPPPVMLLATNRRSTGVGARPRGKRIEITADFTPNPALMVAAGTVITGIARELMSWPSYDLAMLEAARLPLIQQFAPIPHTSRHGWLARFDCYPQSPFSTTANERAWHVAPAYFSQRGRASHLLSLREITRDIVRYFWPPILKISDAFTRRLILSVLAGRTPSLLDLPDRPPAYEDVGRRCTWGDLFPEHVLSRSRYERVLTRAVAGHKLPMRGRRYTPIGMRGWSEVLFRCIEDGTQHVFSLDDLLPYLEPWERDQSPAGWGVR